MDGVHDLGGKEGFGPIAVTHEHRAFAQPWEGRMEALSQVVGPEDLTIDWFRFLVELIPPGAYLTIPYFEKWCLTTLAALVHSGEITLEALLAGDYGGGDAASPAPEPKPASVEAVLQTLRDQFVDFSRPYDKEPAFSVGDEVLTQSQGVPGHTRLPAYARGRRGRVTAHHGAHLLPDAGWQGLELALPLYTVSFEARELWGPTGAEGDSVMLDLWEPYLVAVGS